MSYVKNTCTDQAVKTWRFSPLPVVYVGVTPASAPPPTGSQPEWPMASLPAPLPTPVTQYCPKVWNLIFAGWFFQEDRVVGLQQ